MLKSTIAMLATTLLLVGCAAVPGTKSLATLRAECNTGDSQSCIAGDLHPQRPINDAAIAASIEAALNDAVRVGTQTATLTHRRYSSIQ